VPTFNTFECRLLNNKTLHLLTNTKRTKKVISLVC